MEGDEPEPESVVGQKDGMKILRDLRLDSRVGEGRTTGQVFQAG